ncbi:uncharacterized protein N7459_000391 [Penicillium hispanicum]|uniref:uncharacterized protein n=1 Tax=Penicillium hispanicum TaxID=1080232 RepID=UPI00253FE32C|nr:uncharacterized protein N7459_000391 [Penicillium hispanicum]KAJ5594183.1 hypothetical protein N7459_000391 [Penicillium hispanicum]
MARDVPMAEPDNLDASSITVRPSESPTWIDDAGYTSTDPSEHSVNDSGPPTPTHRDASCQFPKTAAAEVFYPYAVEEPDDEPDSSIRRLDLLSLPDSLERWQRDLVDRMDELGCNSDASTGARPSTSESRGRKRKSANAAGGVPRHASPRHQSKSKTRQSEPPSSAPGLGPKRRRRRVRQPGDSAKTGPPFSLHDFREVQTNESSGSDRQSTDSSGADTGNEPMADSMDLD